MANYTRLVSSTVPFFPLIKLNLESSLAAAHFLRTLTTLGWPGENYGTEPRVIKLRPGCSLSRPRDAPVGSGVFSCSPLR